MSDVAPAANRESNESGTSAAIAVRQIAGWRIVRRLGRGGMGAVFLCEEPNSRGRRAVKLLAADEGEPLAERLRREAPALADMHHPNLVRLERFGEENGVAYLFMPYLGDERGPHTLERHLRERGGALPAAEVGRIVRQLLQGLSHAHKAGLTHCNLKPSNVLLDHASDTLSAKIGDLGLVRLASEEVQRRRVYASISQSVSFAGAALADDEAERANDALDEDEAAAADDDAPLLESWAYMAPEQRMPAGRTDHRTDLYAVGLLAYRMLRGRLPDAISRSPDRLGGRLAGWNAWIERSLNLDPEARFQTAREALDALPEQTQANAGAKTATLVTIAAATALLVVGAIVAAPLLSSLWYGDDVPPPQPQPAPQTEPEVPETEPELSEREMSEPQASGEAEAPVEADAPGEVDAPAAPPGDAPAGAEPAELGG